MRRFFDSPVDAPALKFALGRLATIMPTIAGRRIKAGFILTMLAHASPWKGHDGSARNVCETYHNVDKDKRTLADVPHTCAGGQGPLMTVRVTNYGRPPSGGHLSRPGDGRLVH